LEFERKLAEKVREVGRAAAEFAYNHLEPEEPQVLPHYLHYEAGQYRRLNRKTPNREVATPFGKVTLWRHGFRYIERDTAEPTTFPLEIQMGLVEGATPTLAGIAAKALAETGATQEVALARLREQYAVEWGVKKLRAVAESVSAGMEPLGREHQARQSSRGSSRRPPRRAIAGRHWSWDAMGLRCAPAPTASSRWLPRPR